MNYKISQYAKKHNVTYRTVWNWVKEKKVNHFKTKTGSIVITEDENKDCKVAIYARVSSSENKKNLESQKERLLNYCAAKGYNVEKVITEIGSGLNDKRKNLEKLLLSPEISIIVVEHSDRLARFGFNYIRKLLELNNRKLEIINIPDNNTDDLMQDFVSIITSFTARLYGLRRSKRKTEEIIKQLKEDK